ncbi:hypothetical protein [Gorillibacterium sp. CAU 1737]|uniref:hypothetical protein n=1 Tax=Gorillibacterium sp. CAU 1737 TaxID=3140362 RepID=UPI0032608557
MSTAKVWMLITGIFEILLGIPVLGGLFILSTFYTPLFVMFFLHIVTLAVSARYNEAKHGSILGIITSLVAVIPFVGMVMHLITGILLVVSAAQKQPQHRTTNM